MAYDYQAVLAQLDAETRKYVENDPELQAWMKKHQLDAYETSIEVQIEKGNVSSVENIEEEKKKFVKAAKDHNKRRKITINVYERYIQKLKFEAQREGIPYQTLINSIIHKYMTKQLIDKKYLELSSHQTIY